MAELTSTERRRIYEREPKDWTDEELFAVLVDRYAPTVVPPCRICGGALSCQQIGAGVPTIWGCSGDIWEGETQIGWQPGRTFADEHYRRSHWEDYRQGGDAAVMEMLRRRPLTAREVPRG